MFGAPGVGKSFVLRKIKEVLLESNQKCEAIAPTHAAARLIDGTTVHYFLGKYSKYAFEGWVLLDEISMLTLPLIAALSQMVSRMKIICFGDFDQLNPCFNSWRGKPIEENVFEHSQLLKTWSENTNCKLTKCRRSDKQQFGVYCGLSNNLEEATHAVVSRLKRKRMETCM